MTTSLHSIQSKRIFGLVGIGLLAVFGMTLAGSVPAHAASVLSGPIDLGTSASYGVLGGSAVTNTGQTVVNGDLGVDPGSSITGFTGAPNGSSSGAVNDDNSAAAQAQADLTTAFNAAAGLTPTTSGLAELNGLSLTPGVYSGGALSLANNGSLTLAGSATSVWVFQAASSLTIGSAAQILITGGATACNVFWEIGSSASIGTSAQFQGTIMAKQSITAATTATIQGRLLANTAAVTLESNTITAPIGCAAGSAPTSTNGPAITSGSPTDASLGSPYLFTLTASGAPLVTYALSGGALPVGLVLDSSTGTISGTPRSTGVSNFRIGATNGTAPDVAANLTITVVGPALALTGVNPAGPLAIGLSLLLAGLAFGGARYLRRRRRS